MQIFLFMNGSIFHFKGRVLCTLFYANFPCYVWSINSLVLRSLDSGYSIIIVNYMKLRDLISKAIINHEIKGELFIIVRYSAIILAKCCFDRWKENKLTKISISELYHEIIFYESRNTHFQLLHPQCVWSFVFHYWPWLPMSNRLCWDNCLDNLVIVCTLHLTLQ